MNSAVWRVMMEVVEYLIMVTCAQRADAEEWT
jgi:hypothetical protein